MKKIFILFLTVMLSAIALPAMGQLTKPQQREPGALSQSSRKELDKKASKGAKNEAKKLKKEGWAVTPGALPLEKQLDRAYMMQYEFDSDMIPKYIFGEAMSIGANYDAAHLQATELAKQNLAGQIETGVTALIENTVANEQLSLGEAESVIRTITASKNLISQSIGRTIPVVEVYRTLPNGNKEVMVMLAYGSEQAFAVAKKTIREDLEKRGDNLQRKLDELLGW